jgi:hypothetical protein
MPFVNGMQCGWNTKSWEQDSSIKYGYKNLKRMGNADMKGKIRVYARWRPLSEKEHRENQRNVLSSPDEFTLEHPWKEDKPKQHQFDHVFDQFATQEQIFNDTKVYTQNLSLFLFCGCLVCIDNLFCSREGC